MQSSSRPPLDSSTRRRYTEAVELEWDLKKAAKNLRKHKVSFTEAATVLADPLSVTVRDPDHSADEDRYITWGQSKRFRLVMVSHADRGERVRIVSARPMAPAEREAYEEQTQG